MLDAVTLDPGDRVLFLTVPHLDLLEEISSQVTRGLVTAIGPREEVFDSRRAAAHLDNVMLTPGEPVEIPWQESFFSWIIDTTGGWTLDAAVAREIHRVLAPAGRIWLANLNVAPLLELGLVDAGSGRDYRLLLKPAESEPAGANGRFRII